MADSSTTSAAHAAAASESLAAAFFGMDDLPSPLPSHAPFESAATAQKPKGSAAAARDVLSPSSSALQGVNSIDEARLKEAMDDLAARQKHHQAAAITGDNDGPLATKPAAPAAATAPSTSAGADATLEKLAAGSGSEKQIQKMLSALSQLASSITHAPSTNRPQDSPNTANGSTIMSRFGAVKGAPGQLSGVGEKRLTSVTKFLPPAFNEDKLAPAAAGQQLVHVAAAAAEAEEMLLCSRVAARLQMGGGNEEEREQLMALLQALKQIEKVQHQEQQQQQQDYHHQQQLQQPEKQQGGEDAERNATTLVPPLLPPMPLNNAYPSFRFDPPAEPASHTAAVLADSYALRYGPDGALRLARGSACQRLVEGEIGERRKWCGAVGRGAERSGSNSGWGPESVHSTLSDGGRKRKSPDSQFDAATAADACYNRSLLGLTATAATAPLEPNLGACSSFEAPQNVPGLAMFLSDLPDASPLMRRLKTAGSGMGAEGVSAATGDFPMAAAGGSAEDCLAGMVAWQRKQLQLKAQEQQEHLEQLQREQMRQELQAQLGQQQLVLQLQWQQQQQQRRQMQRQRAQQEEQQQHQQPQQQLPRSHGSGGSEGTGTGTAMTNSSNGEVAREDYNNNQCQENRVAHHREEEEQQEHEHEQEQENDEDKEECQATDDWLPRCRATKTGPAPSQRIKQRSMAERRRRERISEGLQKLRVKVRGRGDTCAMLAKAVNYVDSLERRVVELESFLLAGAGPRHGGGNGAAGVGAAVAAAGNPMGRNSPSAGPLLPSFLAMAATGAAAGGSGGSGIAGARMAANGVGGSGAGINGAFPFGF